MRKTAFVVIGVMVLCGLAAHARQKATEKDLIGTWAGKYTGGTTGSYEMTITKASDGKLGGSVSPTPDTGDPYTTPFNSVVFAEGKATMKCFDPPGEVEITLEATVEGAVLKGTYAVRARADGTEVDRGTFTGAKKAAKDRPPETRAMARGSRTRTMNAASATPSHWLERPRVEARSNPKRG